MRFVLRMALRETRASWRRLLFFFICIAVGVAAIVTLRSVIQSVRGAFANEARTLISADVLVSTIRDWVPATRELIERRLNEAGVAARTDTLETPTMVRPTDASRLAVRMVELRAVGPEFPLYGTVGLESGTAREKRVHVPRLARRGRERCQLVAELLVTISRSLSAPLGA